jgi:hypothetical protein
MDWVSGPNGFFRFARSFGRFCREKLDRRLTMVYIAYRYLKDLYDWRHSLPIKSFIWSMETRLQWFMESVSRTVNQASRLTRFRRAKVTALPPRAFRAHKQGSGLI